MPNLIWSIATAGKSKAIVNVELVVLVFPAGDGTSAEKTVITLAQKTSDQRRE